MTPGFTKKIRTRPKCKLKNNLYSREKVQGTDKCSVANVYCGRFQVPPNELDWQIKLFSYKMYF